ncbi:glutathione S-transferase [Thalassobaculum fulvum]|uniref:Glutathione S-transferase n=1 Tax=Thalassobaculum fulvum TaxID=1633335 RepID=A0A918XWQ7_9PROT|nr:glutathione S-transferase [Thalassobaculum fulvum]
MAAHEMGLASRLEVVHHETSPTRRNDAVYAGNPLGKVPVLLLDDGTCLFDSAVIVDYLDGLHDGPRLIPEGGPARFAALRLQAVANGMAEAGIAVRWETERRPEALRYPALAEGQLGKLREAYAFAEADPALGDPAPSGPVTVGQVALATALSWLEFRGVAPFRAGHPRLAAWLDRFAERPSMRATPLSGATHD